MPKSPWIYTGDVNIEHGGQYLDLSGLDDFGTVEVVQITDLDSACGYEGATLIEKGTLNFPALSDVAKWNDILTTCGYRLENGNVLDGAGGIIDATSHEGNILRAESLLAYRGVEDAEQTTVAVGKGAPNYFRAWTLDRRLRGGTNLRNWIERNFL